VFVDACCLRTSDILADLPQTLAVGWSGGIDSTALLLSLKAEGYDVQAWHVDHAWHAASAQDAQQLAQWALDWGIALHIKRLPEPSGVNREAAARQGRYRAFQQLAQELGVHTVALAHHADDQAETVCMRMLQGSGVMGVRGMAAQSEYGSLQVYRPFLHVRRASLKQLLEDASVAWLDDSSNEDMSLWRNRIRRQLFPCMVDAGYEPFEIFMRWQKQALKVAALIKEEINQITLMDGDKHCSVEQHVWLSLSKAARAEVLQRMASSALGKGVVLGRRHIELIETWQQKSGRGGVDLSSCRLSLKRGYLHLEASKATSRS